MTTEREYCPGSGSILRYKKREGDKFQCTACGGWFKANRLHPSFPSIATHKWDGVWSKNTYKGLGPEGTT